MRFSSTFLALGAFVSGIAAQDPTSQDANSQTAQSVPTQTASGLSEPCASIQAAQISASSNGNQPGSIIHTPSVAWACIKSIPLNKDDAVPLLQWAQTWYPFISTLGWLKSPPPSYVRESVDFLGELDSIASKVNSTGSDAYTSQADLDLALLNLTLKTRDFHNNVFDFAAVGMFSFRTNFSVVSISSDGVALPKIYCYDDILRTTNASPEYTPSAIKSLGGKDPVEFLRNYTAVNLQSPFIEEHTEWNAQMNATAAGLNRGFPTSFDSTTIFNGDTLSVEFENGTSFVSNYEATTNLDIRQATNMDDIYSLGVLLGQTASPTPFPTVLPPVSATTEPGFTSTEAPITDAAGAQVTEVPETSDTVLIPDIYERKRVNKEVTQTPVSSFGAPFPTNPVVVQKDLGVSGVVTGYHFESESLAVLSLPKFSGNNDETASQGVSWLYEFTQAVEAFINRSTQAGMKNVVIDVTDNGGGSIVLAYDTFKRFFPDTTPFAGWNLRATAQISAIGTSYTSALSNDTIKSALAEVGLLNRTLKLSNAFNVAGDESDSGTIYRTWSEAAGPDNRNGDNFTNTIRFDISNSTIMSGVAGGDITDVYGYGSNPATRSRPWDPSNIVLLTDGTCGSTCAVFAEMMKTDAGVRSIVMGGLPVTGPMQAVSGSRGSEVLTIPSIAQTAAGIRIFNPGDDIVSNLPPNLVPSRLGQSAKGKGGRVNIKNSVRTGSDVPLQFTYQAADCRLWYTAAMVTDYSAKWKAVASVAFDKNTTLCVQGSTDQVTAKPNVTSIDPPNATTIDNSAQASGTSTSPPSGTAGAPASTSSKAIAATGTVAHGAFVSFVAVLASALMLF